MNRTSICSVTTGLTPPEVEPQLHITILGGGPAGLAAAFYARKSALSFAVFEASCEIGGNARTLRHGPFMVDTGAHRFHDRDPQSTRDVMALLGDDLLQAEIPSQIVYGNRFVDFPLSPLDLLQKLGARKVMAATADMARSRLSRLPDEPSFRDVALRRYGRTIADAFLLHYTEKLWSTPAERLSPAVSGKRLKGLDVRTFVMETFAGRRSKTKHLDGSFHYPRLGIGMLMDRLADAVGRESIRTEARITRLRHAHERIFELEINGTERVPVDRIVSTLPISLLMSILDPPPPEEVLTAARALRFQSVTLVVLFLSRAQVTRAASLYFPDPTIPFTRAYEPKNRSAAMSPHDCTSLAIEIPGTPAVLPMKDEAALIQAVTDILTRIGIIESKDVTGSLIHHIPFAYPILELGTEARLTTITDYLERFRNLHSIGRGGAFAYVHIHDLMYAAREVTESVLASRS